MNIILQEHFFRALNEDYYDSEDIIAKAKQIGAFTELLDSLKAYLEYDDKNKCWVYLRGDVSGRDFYTGVPIQYITDNEKSNLAEDVIEDGVLEYYDWDGLDIDEVKEFMYEDDILIDSLISALDDEDTANLDEHLIEDDRNSIGKSYIKNKRRLKESMQEIDRRYFASLNKEGDGHYYILVDGNYEKDFYADSDEEAKKKFQQWERKDESLSLNEDWTHFEFTSGSNPYIATTEKEKNRMLKKYKGKVQEVKPGFYKVDDKNLKESLWDLVKGYLEEGLTESMWEPADKQELERLRQDIKKTKSKLLSQIKRKHGVWENFGQKELRALNDKYAKLHFTPEYNALIDEFRNWCDEQY